MVLAIFLGAVPARGIEVGSVSSMHEGSFTSPVGSVSFNHTVGSGLNRILIVATASEWNDGDNGIIDSVRFGGLSMTLIADTNATAYSSGTYMTTSLYYLLNPPAGEATVEINYVGVAKQHCMAAMSLLGVRQVAPSAGAANDNYGTSTISTDIYAPANSWVIDVVGHGEAGSFTAEQGDMVERWDIQTNSAASAGSTRVVSTAGTATNAWRFQGNANRMAHSVAILEPFTFDADLDSDLKVDLSDLAMFANQWLGNGTADFDGSSTVDFEDYAVLADEYLKGTGKLAVNISPPQAVVEGAQWKVDDSGWHNSGQTVSGLTATSHLLSFRQLGGWLAPLAENVIISQDLTLTLNKEYQVCTFGCPFITEFMASNATTILDGDGVSSDWIEIYNPTDSPVDLAGWYLTDDREELDKWPFPDAPEVELGPGEYLLVFASGQEVDDYKDAAGYWHANFKLSADGGYLALVKPDLTIAYAFESSDLGDEWGYPKQQTDISYGIFSEEERYFPEPSPGTQNSGAYIGQVADTTFDCDRGFYDEPFQVTIETETQGAVIHYTLNGSEPATTITGGTHYYTGPIAINTTTCLRAKAFKPGWMPSNADTQTYIFLSDVINQSASPTMADGTAFPASWKGNYLMPGEEIGPSGEVPADYEMDPDVVTDPAYSATIENDLKAIPTISLVTDMVGLFDPEYGIYANCRARGETWERACSMELINPDNSEGFGINAGLRIYGGWGSVPKRSPKHSWRILFKSEYGSTKLKYPLFSDDATDEFDTLILRGAFNIAWNQYEVDGEGTSEPYRVTAQYTRDEFVRRTQLAVGRASAHGRYVHLYLNGLYWGLYNLAERPDMSFAATYFGGNKEEYDALNSGEVVADSSKDSWNAAQAVAEAGVADRAGYEALAQRVDIENLIDYMLHNFYTGTFDWDNHNWYAACRRGGGKYEFFDWDGECSLYDPPDRNNWITMVNNPDKPSRFYAKLRENPEFRMQFADHVHRHFFNDGALTYQKSRDRYEELTDLIDRAIVGESARWADCGRPDQPYTRDVEWVAERDYLLNVYFPARTNIVLGWLQDADLYPDTAAPVFCVNGAYKHGGYILPSDVISITAAAGTIYYTLDGSDPRQAWTGNAVGSVYSTPFTLVASTKVRARARSGGEWSALNEAVYAIGPLADSLRISELMYHPDDANTEYIELTNIGSRTINLRMVKFDKGVDFEFGNTSLASGQYVLVVEDETAFRTKYGSGATVAGEYTGSLDNAGERVVLKDAAGRMIQDFRYEDEWFSQTDGEGFSLTVIDETSGDPNEWGREGGWRPSAFAGGSAGWDDSGDTYNPGAIVINEVLAHSDVYPGDWIELHNTTGGSIDIGGWYLSDDQTSLKKYQIPASTAIAAGGYVVFTQDEDFGGAFGLSENGEAVYLSSAQGGVLTGYREQQDFGASDNGVAFGRHLKSTGTYDFTAMSVNSPGAAFQGAANSYPRVGPIVISEIMYNPGMGSQLAEYIELRNISGANVTLYDAAAGLGWKFTDGIDFTFPVSPPTTIPAGGRLIVAKDLAKFAAEYGSIPGGVQVLGPYMGQLDNGGERLQLAKPGDEAEDVRYWIYVERVSYSDGSHDEDSGGADPWPAGADGTGQSLTRVAASQYGNDPANWQAAEPSPGL